jgi:hypothetical protein
VNHLAQPAGRARFAAGGVDGVARLRAPCKEIAMAPIVRRVVIAIAALVSAACLPTAGLADVPPHQPGTVCYTPAFWCWARPPGAAGEQCTCANPNGGPPVKGTLG